MVKIIDLGLEEEREITEISYPIIGCTWCCVGCATKYEKVIAIYTCTRLVGIVWFSKIKDWAVQNSGLFDLEMVIG